MSRPFDGPLVAPDPRVILAWSLALLALYALAPRLPWLRLYRWADSVEFAAPSVAVAVARWCRAAVGRVRAALDPVAEERRALGRYLAALPPRSGLTVYEEWLKEARALPPGPARASVFAQIRRLSRPSAEAVALARARAGKPVVEPSVVAALLRGKEPAPWRNRREKAERRRALAV